MGLPRNLLLAAACAGLLGACADRSADASTTAAAPPAAEATKAATAKKAGDGTLRWNNTVVWEGDLSACRQGDAAVSRDCLLQAMRKANAGSAALGAAEQLSSGGELAYVSAFHDYQGVGVAKVSYPFRANTNEGTLLIDAQGQRINVDADPAGSDLRADPALLALLQAHPGAMPFAPAQAAGSTPLEGGGVRLLYRTPLRECHACADVAQVQVGYAFDAQRRFVGRSVVQ